MNNISLYELIKKISQEKGRPLKVISDWDETLQGNKSLTFYKVYAKHYPNCTFADFFKDYWEKSTITYKSHGNNVITHLDIIENARQNDPKKFNEEFQTIKGDPNFYDTGPFLSFAKDLLMLVKEEGLISELVIVSSYREEAYSIEGEPKKEVFKKTFAKFPQCKLDLESVKREVTAGKFLGKRISARWKVLKKKIS